MKPAPKPSDYATGKEYRWAKKAAAKEATAPVRGVISLVLLVLVPVWIFTGSFIAALVAGLAAPCLFFALIVLAARAKAA